MENKILALIGTSGSGKSTLQESLIKEYPDKYETVGQFTTRPKRNKQETNLIHITKEQYDTIKSNLVGKCYFNDNYYGSLICNLDNNKIKIITVTIEGYIDLLNNTEDLSSIYTIVLLNNNFTDMLSIRKNRSLEFLEQEYNQIKNYVYNVENMKDKGYFIMNLKHKEYPKVEFINELCSRYFDNKEEKEYRNYFLTKINVFINKLGNNYFSINLSDFMNEYSPGSKLFSFSNRDFTYEDINDNNITVWYEDLNISDLENIYNILENEYDNQIKTLERCKD